MKLDLLEHIIKLQLESGNLGNMAAPTSNGGAEEVENLSGQMQQVDLQGIVGMDGVENVDLKDLPSSLIITNVDETVFENDSNRVQFETAVKVFENTASVYYLRNFRRARVDYQCPLAAVQARIRLNETQICGSKIKCFFAQPLKVSDTTGPHLQPPEPEKQFLISPPASPPVGWEPINESEPVINYELLAALASLQPGEIHELHAQTEHQPGIVVHVCEDPEGYLDRMKPKIVQTRRPDVSQ